MKLNLFKKKQTCALEAAEACALIKWASLHPICRDTLIAIPNGGRRDAREAKNLKLQGVKSGVSDYFLPVPVTGIAPTHYGLWIELKRVDPRLSKPTKSQLDWIIKMRRRGYAAEIAYGADQAIAIIKDYLAGHYSPAHETYEYVR